MVIAAAFTVSGCGGGASGGSADDGTIAVVASFYPLAYAAQRVGGDSVNVFNLTPAGVDPHDLELAPEDLERIALADVVVYLGGGFQPAVEEAVEAEATGISVDVSHNADLLPPSQDGAQGLDDPHVWLDPTLYAGVVSRVRDALGGVQASDQDRFGANAQTLDEELAALDEVFRRGLAECETRVLITNHAAFGYLAQAYDLDELAISGAAPEAEADPQRIAELVAIARAEGVTTIFAESEDAASGKVADTLAAEADLETAVLSPLENLTQAQVDTSEDYLSLMRSNLEVLRDGLVCA